MKVTTTSVARSDVARVCVLFGAPPEEEGRGRGNADDAQARAEDNNGGEDGSGVGGITAGSGDD